MERRALHCRYVGGWWFCDGATVGTIRRFTKGRTPSDAVRHWWNLRMVDILRAET